VVAEGSTEVKVWVTAPGGEELERSVRNFEGAHTSFLWGLREQTDYSVRAEAEFNGEWHVSESLEFTTQPLPSGIPPIELVAHDESRAHEGLVIIPTVTDAEQIYLGVDVEGYVVWYKRTGFLGTNIGGDAKLLGDGRLFLFRPGGIQIIEPWGERIWGGDREHHHDVTPMPDGGMIMLRRREEMLDVDEFGGLAWVKVDGVVEVDADGSEVAQWWGSDHLDHQDWPSSLGKNIAPYDWTHGNAVVYQEELGRILVSMRHHSAVYAIAWPTGEIQWRLGPGGDFSFVGGSEDWFYNQHSPQPQPDGKLLLYDNGNERPGAEAYSRAVLLDIDEEAMQVSVAWEHEFTPQTLVQGDADILPNGNVLIGAGGVQSTGNPVRVIEASSDAASEIVWELQMPESQGVYRATHVAGF
jgi:hypothetical protein